MTIRIDAGEAGVIEVSRPTREAYREYFDSMKAGRAADAMRNLWASCAISPTAAELPALISDFDALPSVVGMELAKEGGYSTELYPMVPLEQVPEEIRAQSKAKNSRRASVAFNTPGGLLLLRPSGGGDAWIEAQPEAAKGNASYYEAARSLLLARADVPDAPALAAIVEQYPAIPAEMAEMLYGLATGATGGKAPARL